MKEDVDDTSTTEYTGDTVQKYCTDIATLVLITNYLTVMGAHRIFFRGVGNE